MISYVLVLIESLATGQLTHAYLEGPMSDSWCQQLIERSGYSAEDETSRLLPSCVSWPSARQTLSEHFCRPIAQPGPPWRRHFDCDVAPAAAGRTVAHTTALPDAAVAVAHAAAPPQAAVAVTHAAALPEASVAVPHAAALPDAALAVAHGAALPDAAAAAHPTATVPPPPAVGPAVAESARGAFAPAAPADADDRPDPEVLAPAAKPGARQFRLGPAAAALLEQAHAQSSGRHDEIAAATVERALRIEPDNPLVWIELGRLRMRAGDAAQADSTARKALALAGGDVQVQAAAWRLIAESLRARRRNQEAADADRMAAALSAQ